MREGEVSLVDASNKLVWKQRDCLAESAFKIECPEVITFFAAYLFLRLSYFLVVPCFPYLFDSPFILFFFISPLILFFIKSFIAPFYLIRMVLYLRFCFVFQLNIFMLTKDVLGLLPFSRCSGFNHKLR